MADGWGGARPGAGRKRKSLAEHRRDHTRPHYDSETHAEPALLGQADHSKSLPEPPHTFSSEGRDLWFALLDEYDLDGLGVERLIVACEAFDRYQAARQLLDREGIVIRDRFGQQQPHPAIAIERSARAAYLRALRDVEAS